ncbi:hypothetical protein BV25DRAFT_1798454 [Artomyces pyxidatus]|uniref:Uncharacterized protein n=1 Tax=Artomyces pyxidatus TaxID=48021 RepID=A0ACB8TB34_9AGAM|nr:hypothetical protein BV25DRAFT_1798454 [Artomyces pyxidatus]
MLALVRPPRRAVLRAARLLHASAPRCDRVGPPDPISNIRPILYDDPLPDSPRHPYSLSEFRGDTRDYQWKLQRQQLDAWNHAFWTDSNTRFECGRAAALSRAEATPEAQERALADFYRDWVVQEGPRQDEYNRELRRRTVEEIKLSVRVHYWAFRARMAGLDTPPP